MYKVAYKTLVRPYLENAAPIRSLYLKLQINQIDKVQRRAAHWTCSGETRLVLAKCLMSLGGYRLRTVGFSSPCFSFTRFIVVQCLLIMVSTWPLLTVWKLPGHRIAHNTVAARHTVMPWIPPWNIPHWNSLSSYVVYTQTSEEFRALLV